MSEYAFTNPSPGGDNSKELFLKRIREVYVIVADAAQALNDDYNQSSLNSLSKRFEAISTEFIRYTIVENSQFHDFIKRSETRIQAVNQIIIRATDVARWFERCAKGELLFTGVDGRQYITNLGFELENLINKL